MQFQEEETRLYLHLYQPKTSHPQAVGSGLAGPVVATPMFGQPTRAKNTSFGMLCQLQDHTWKAGYHLKDFCWGVEASAFWHPKKVLVEA